MERREAQGITLTLTTNRYNDEAQRPCNNRAFSDEKKKSNLSYVYENITFKNFNLWTCKIFKKVFDIYEKQKVQWVF